MARFQNGWVKISRSIANGSYDAIDIGLMTWLIISANYVDGKAKIIGKIGRVIIKRGQLVTSISEISRASKLSFSVIRKRLKAYADEGFLTSQTTNKGTIITILNYDKFQCFDIDDEQTKEQAKDKQKTNRRQTEDKQKTNSEQHIEELKNLRKEEGNKLRKEDSAAMAIATPPSANELIKYYCEKFKQQYGRNPVIIGREAGAAKTLLKSMSLEKAMRAVDGYFQITDPWLVQRMHPLSTLQEPSMINKAMGKEPLTIDNIEKIRKTNPFFEGLGETLIEIEGIKK